MKPPSRAINVALFEPYPFGRIAGNLRTQLLYLRHVDRRWVNLIVVAPVAGGFLSAAKKLGAEVVVVPTPPALTLYGGALVRGGLLTRLRGVLGLIRYTCRLRRALRERHVDVLYCNGVRGALLAGPAARVSGIPVLTYVKGALQSGAMDMVALLLSNRVLFFCASNRDDRYPALIRLIRRRVGILPIGVDVDEVRQGAAAGADTAPPVALDRRRLNIAFVGQLYPAKGVDVLLKVMPEVVRRFPQVHLYIVGHEIIKEYRGFADGLQRTVAEAGLAGHVTFTGWREDALQIVNGVEILVHPARLEGFGRAVLEAMALEKCVVATAVGGLREFIQNGSNGLLVPPDDEEALLEALTTVLGDPETRRRLGRAAAESVAKELSVARNVRRMEAEWLRLAGSGGGMHTAELETSRVLS